MFGVTEISLRLLRIRASDVSLCVLSLPEVLSESANGPCIQIPGSLDALITPETYFLFNKSDLPLSPTAHKLVEATFGSRAWVASLTTGEGTNEFLVGFARALQNRYDRPRYYYCIGIDMADSSSHQLRSERR